MKVLVINAGSSSLKYQLIDVSDETVIAKGICERIGMKDGKIKYAPENGEAHVFEKDMIDHTAAIKVVLDALVDPKIGVLKSMSEIFAVGHRLVHGGEKFTGSALITEEMLDTMEELTELAPLHNPANLMGIRACKAIMKDTPMVGVFDTAFHQTMPEKAFLYGLPYEAYTDLKIRRYGFHGTSHMYVSQRAAKLLNKPVAETKIITCHLGNGSSITAVQGGKSVDTTMGFTPLEGVPMGTRCGDIDPAIVTYLMEKNAWSVAEVNAYMNKKSGVFGLSGVSSDFRDLTNAEQEGNARASAALDVFAYRVKRYIGAYAAVMNGVDAVVFTAGIGENDDGMRARIMKNMEYLGIDFDNEINTGCRAKEVELTKPGSKVRVFVIPTDEEMVIARDTARIVAQN
ncbi:acetate kinase [Christensenellaceae bacterium OttesenSCG-928-L17]|nr:acetate kinase [Christensenellaceae bacterium OttesenSCG-928-L17]